jgi:hypothetical protein
MSIEWDTEERKLEMKKILVVFSAILFGAALAFADAVDDGLPGNATEQLKASTRQMIHQGLKTDEALKITRLMLENRFKQENMLKAQQILISAHQQGLPVEPIMDKTLEGIAKHVKDGHIVRAMEHVHTNYVFAAKQARTISQNRVQMAQLSKVMVDGFAAGMTHEDARRIMQTLQNRAQHMASGQSQELALETFMTVRTMARLDKPSKSVADSICQAIQHGYNARQMSNMRSAVMANSLQTSSRSMTKGQKHNFGQHGGQSGMGGHDSGMGGNGGGSGGMGGGGGKGGGHM